MGGLLARAPWRGGLIAHGVAGKIEVGLGDEGRSLVGERLSPGEDKAFRLNRG